MQFLCHFCSAKMDFVFNLTDKHAVVSYYYNFMY